MERGKTVRIPIKITKMGNNTSFTIKKDIAQSLNMKHGQTWLIELIGKIGDVDGATT
jgi:antitoxin component of MazEF toxin-antitoxin module